MFLILTLMQPGIPFVAANFQSPGWVFTGVMFICFTFVSGFSTLLIIEAIQAIPGNAHFQGDVEFATLINFYFGPWSHLLGQFFLYCSLQSNAIQNIVLAAQSTDKMLIAIFKQSCGVQISGGLRWVCVNSPGSDPSALGDNTMLFTIGYLVVLACTIPLGIFNIDDNMGVQLGGFVMALVILLQWCSSATSLNPQNTPAFSQTPMDYGKVVGNVMLNLAVTTIIPSWINIKKREVSAQKTVWISLFFTTFVYIIIGMFLALGFYINTDGNVIPSLLQYGVPASLTSATVFLFAYAMLIPSIPVNMIISRNNLYQNNVVTKVIADVLAYVVPILISIPFQTGTSLNIFQTWTSLIFVSVANFIIPVIIYFRCLEFRKLYNSNRVLTIKQRGILKNIHTHSETIKNFIDNRDYFQVFRQRAATILRHPSGKQPDDQQHQLPDLVIKLDAPTSTAGSTENDGCNSSIRPTPNNIYVFHQADLPGHSPLASSFNNEANEGSNTTLAILDASSTSLVKLLAVNPGELTRAESGLNGGSSSSSASALAGRENPGGVGFTSDRTNLEGLQINTKRIDGMYAEARSSGVSPAHMYGGMHSSAHSSSAQQISSVPGTGGSLPASYSVSDFTDHPDYLDQDVPDPDVEDTEEEVLDKTSATDKAVVGSQPSSAISAISGRLFRTITQLSRRSRHSNEYQTEEGHNGSSTSANVYSTHIPLETITKQSPIVRRASDPEAQVQITAPSNLMKSDSIRSANDQQVRTPSENLLRVPSQHLTVPHDDTNQRTSDAAKSDDSRSISLEGMSNVPPTNLARSDISRARTLPSHPSFRTPAFRTWPKWAPFKTVHVAWTVLVFTSVVSIANIVLSAYAAYLASIEN